MPVKLNRNISFIYVVGRFFPSESHHSSEYFKYAKYTFNETNSTQSTTDIDIDNTQEPCCPTCLQSSNESCLDRNEYGIADLLT